MDIARNITAPPSTAPVSIEQAQELKGKIQESLAEIRQAKGWDEYIDTQDRAEIEILEAKLKSSLALIENFLETGEWSAPETGATNQSNSSQGDQALRNLQPGWNGDITLRTNPPPGYGDLTTIVPDADFQGFVYINDTADPAKPPQLVFEASATTKKIEAFNHGRDIVYVETYLDPQGAEKKRFWVGVDHATNIQAQILVTAHNADAASGQGVVMDFHKVYRVSDGSHGLQYGTTGGFTFIGSDLNDTIIGSQGDDILVGLKGDDTLRGEGGVDRLYGDDSYFSDPIHGITPDMARQQLGLRTDLPDGDDTLDGGVGTDILAGDGGVNYGFDTDAVSGPNVEHQSNIQHHLAANNQRLPDTDWLVTTGSDKTEGWGNVREVKPGVVEISETESSGNPRLTLKMPPDFDYTYAENDLATQGIRITFVKHIEGGVPQTFVVVIKGALRDRTGNLLDPFTLKFIGNGRANIIDFHGIVDFQNNNFVVQGTESDDMILAPTNDLNKQGWSLEDLLNPNNRVSGNEISNTYLGTVVPEAGEAGGDNEGVMVGSNADHNEIVVARARTQDEQDDPNWEDKQRTVHIDPADFNKAYVMVDPNKSSDLLVILVNQGVDGGPPQTLVIRIEGYRDFQGQDGDLGHVFNWLSIEPSGDQGTTGGQSQQNGWSDDVIPLITMDHNGQKVSGNIIDAGAGQDFVFRADGDTVENAESQIIGHFIAEEAAQTPPPPPPATDTTNTGDSPPPPPPPPPPGGSGGS